MRSCQRRTDSDPLPASDNDRGAAGAWHRIGRRRTRFCDRPLQTVRVRGDWGTV
jgi:hypothetical protein